MCPIRAARAKRNWPVPAVAAAVVERPAAAARARLRMALPAPAAPDAQAVVGLHRHPDRTAAAGTAQPSSAATSAPTSLPVEAPVVPLPQADSALPAAAGSHAPIPAAHLGSPPARR